IFLASGLVLSDLDFNISVPVGNQTVMLTELSIDSLPNVTAAQVQVSSAGPASFTTALNNTVVPPGGPSDTPVIESAAFQLDTVGGAVQPVVKLTGQHFKWVQPPDAVIFTAAGSNGQPPRTVRQTDIGYSVDPATGKDVVLAVVPQQVALGLCTLQVSRPSPAAVGGGDEFSKPIALTLAS